MNDVNKLDLNNEEEVNRTELIQEIYFLKQELIECKKNYKKLYNSPPTITKEANSALSAQTTTMGEMALAFAHEINQPLTAIAAYSRSCLLLMNKENYAEIRTILFNTLEKIALQAELSGRIIHNMKDFMHVGNLNVEQVHINLLIKETLSIFYYELLDFKLKISLNLQEDLPIIWLNKTHIMQVILNLVRNSVETFQRVPQENPTLTIETHLFEDHIQVHVRDNGPGIPEKLQSIILSTYFTTKASGTGIGLGICQTLIERHGGKFFIQKEEKKGACFTFTLPVKKEDMK